MALKDDIEDFFNCYRFYRARCGMSRWQSLCRAFDALRPMK